MPLKPSEMERVLFEDGWVLYAQKGSHRQYKHPQKKGKVTIPFHKGKEINPVTENFLKKRQTKIVFPLIAYFNRPVASSYKLQQSFSKLINNGSIREYVSNKITL